MLFTYKHIENHAIYALQEWINDLFLNVWCQADPKVEYDIELLPDEIREVTEEIYHDSKITTDYLYGPIENVYKLFQGFDQGVKETLAKAYRDNNCIADLCQNKNGCDPFRYRELKEINEELNNTLETFFKHLFTNVMKLKAVTSRIGEIEIHYKDFVTLNDEDKCPFCGTNDLKGKYVERREAYDHYLPKDVYPFNSINFLNLAPMCYECNSSYKGTKDPLLKQDKTTRRKAFYPYDTEEPNIDLGIKINSKNIESLTPEDIHLTISAKGKEEEVATWMEVFGIEERYKARCLAKNDGKFWYQEATDEYDNLPDHVKAIYPKEQWVDKLIKSAKTNKYAQANFIKSAFLEACKESSIL